MQALKINEGRDNAQKWNGSNVSKRSLRFNYKSKIIFGCFQFILKCLIIINLKSNEITIANEKQNDKLLKEVNFELSDNEDNLNNLVLIFQPNKIIVEQIKKR